MAGHRYENCGFRAKHDKNPTSLLGRIWRWHASWCPGWKRHITSLSDEERIRLAREYSMKKYGETDYKNSFQKKSMQVIM